ncbi:MAG: aminoglycoside phosphotransferase family protein, partial [Chloroflexota bacterium]|nr:aminoglycoside phosphotransferase family protein [Chloroflexota bacterium]
LMSIDPATVPLQPWAGQLTDDPQRMPWAMPGGPDADLAWAADVLRDQGMARTGPPEQIRSWNLSSLWRLPTTGGEAWLKVVPPFFGHEGAILERLAGGPVPSLLGHDGARVILAGIPGEDQYDAPLPSLHALVDILVAIQVAWLGRADALLAVGLPDWRGASLTEAITDLVARAGHRVSGDDRTTLAGFVDGLPERFERIADCGLGDGLVHGDCHPGNVRGHESDLVLLDWGDCGVGHPLLDMPGFLDRIAAEHVAPVRDRWLTRWRDIVPGSDPERAAALIAPVAAARQALIYQRFLDGIESSEHPYHQADVPDWLGRTARLVRSERPRTNG